MAIEFGNSRYVKCGLCGRPRNETKVCECVRPYLRAVPMPERYPEGMPAAIKRMRVAELFEEVVCRAVGFAARVYLRVKK